MNGLHFGSNEILVERAFNTALIEVFQTEFYLFLALFILILLALLFLFVI